MNKTSTLLAALLVASACAAPAHAQWSKKHTDSQGAAAGSKAKGQAINLEHCDEPLGTIAVVEEQEGDWYRYLSSDLRLPSTVPVIRMIIQQSNCFVVVERGRAMQNMMQERALMESGELREGSDFGKGKMVAADYTINPSISFSQGNAAAIGGVLTAFGGKFGGLGSVVGGLKFKKAETMLTMIDNRSGVQIGVAQGNATKTDFGLGLGGGGSGGFGALGGYSTTPEGKALAAAFANAYNNLVVAMRDYEPQQVEGGLGKGGKLKSGD